jgi:ribose transport system permease protein
MSQLVTGAPPAESRAAARPRLSWDVALRLGLLGIVIALAIIFTAGIDLSVGSMLGFSGILMALALGHGIAIPLALIGVLAIATALGLFNGVLIDTAALPPFIVTLGMLGILRGFTQIFGNGQQISFATSAFTDFAADNFLGIPQLFWVLVVIALVAAYLLHLTRRGRHVFAIGSNLEGARRAGINVRGMTFLVYAISARGSILGTFLGVLLVQILTNGLNLLNFDPQVARIVEGALLIVFVYIDHWRKRRLATA